VIISVDFDNPELQRYDGNIRPAPVSRSRHRIGHTLRSFVATSPYVSESDNFIAITKSSPCIRHLKALDLQLENMRREGKLRLMVSALRIIIAQAYEEAELSETKAGLSN